MKNSLPFFLTPPSALLSILISTFLFCLMSVAVKYLDRLPFHELVFFRALIVLMLSYGVLFRGGQSPWGVNRRWLIFRGAAGTIGILGFFYTLQTMPLASAITLSYLSPLFAVFFARLILGEKIYPYQLLCFVVAFVGVFLIKGFDPRITLGQVGVGIGGALFAGLAYTSIRKLSASDRPMVVVFYFPLVNLILLSPYTLTHWVSPVGGEWGYVALVGLLGFAAQYFLTLAFQGDRVANVSIYVYLGTLYSLFFGWWLWGETIPWLAILGMGLIVGAAISNTWIRSRLNT